MGDRTKLELSLPIEDYIPPRPVLDSMRFLEPEIAFGHTVFPMPPYSENPREEVVPEEKSHRSGMTVRNDAEALGWTQFNVGLRCGSVSLATVLEVSTESAQRWLNLKAWLDTPRWFSRRARYYLFDYCDSVGPSVVIRPGLRLLNDSSSVIYPGSQYEDGSQVYWEISPEWTEPMTLPSYLLPANNVVRLRA